MCLPHAQGRIPLLLGILTFMHALMLMSCQLHMDAAVGCPFIPCRLKRATVHDLASTQTATAEGKMLGCALNDLAGYCCSKQSHFDAAAYVMQVAG